MWLSFLRGRCAQYLAQKYRMLIYSGSVDACVPFNGSEEWTRELGFTLKTGWRAWKAGTADLPDSVQQAGNGSGSRCAARGRKMEGGGGGGE